MMNNHERHINMLDEIKEDLNVEKVTMSSQTVKLKTNLPYLNILTDIAGSLADIADKMEKQNTDYDLYIRDMLLIQFMLDNMRYFKTTDPSNLSKERIYRRWMDEIGGKLCEEKK